VCCAQFVAKVLFEDEKVNRMTEALELFEETVNSKWFTKVDIIVFLNKMDLLTKKIVKVPISKYFPQYTGGKQVQLWFQVL
jgi:guanine nucleotide-binding protein G(i) subunit alpha